MGKPCSSSPCSCYPLSSSWSSFGACLYLEHLDLSGCEKITDHTLKKLAIGLGDLSSFTCFDKCSERRAKLLKSSPIPIMLMDDRNLHPTERKHPAIIFKQGTVRWGAMSTPTKEVWVLDSSDLVDIEDTAEWTRRGGLALPEAEYFVETQLVGSLCCCRRSRRRGHRTGSNASFLHQQYALSGETFCGHSTCCTSDMALRTLTGPQCESGIAEFRTKCSSFVGPKCLEHENRTDQSESKRSLRFLSLSGCYQVTDFGLR